ncbi:MAG TPA: hypothetical protein DCM86_06480 [Verrucomicrobiales bacterium]|nr:hypothetical protein [Verrucomicrobiales bacterium]
MKLLSKTEDQFLFQLSELEDVFLRMTLSAFPVGGQGWPGGRASGTPQAAPDAALLAESLGEVRRDQARAVDSFLKSQPPPADGTPGRLMRLPRGDVDWMLQVLNEVRVGSWYALGCPEEEDERKYHNSSESVPHVIRYDFSGWMIAVLLAALETP